MTLMRLFTLFAALLASAVSSAADTVRICTAKPTGTYVRVGQDIRDAAAPGELVVELIGTEGSMDNLSLLAGGKCDAAIVQADAYLLFQRLAKGSRLEIRRPLYLYDELAHLVCRDDVEVSRMRKLTELGRAVRVATGAAGGGSGLTWGSIGVLDAAYASIEQVDMPAADAVEALVSARSVDCLFHVSAPGSPWMRDTVATNSGLKLVAIADRALVHASIDGIEVYEQALIPGDTYPALVEPGSDGVPSLAVRAVLVVLDAWAGANEPTFSSLVRALEAARPAIDRRAAGN